MNNEKESFLNWKVVGLIFAILLVVLVYNTVSDSMNKTKGTMVLIPNMKVNSTSNDTTNTTGNSLTIDQNNGQNNFFNNSISQNNAVLLQDLECISKAAKNKNFTDTAKCGRYLSEDSNRMLGRIKDYKISSPRQEEILNEFKKSLENYSMGGYKLNIGATNGDLAQMEDATLYIHDGTVGINKVETILYGNNTKNVTVLKTG